jgi:CheY-like chemotaxis protein
MTKIILCADDSVTMQSVAEITLRASAYTYVGAKSADEALSKAREKKPALVLADAVMPGRTGYDLCQSLKNDPAFADVPVIVLCGNSQAYDSARGTAVGADGHLTKPWDTQVLLDKIAELLDRVATSGVAKPGVGAGAAAIAPPPPVTPPPVLTAPMGSVPSTPPPALRPQPITPPPAPPGAIVGSAGLGSSLNAPKAVAAPSPPRSATIMGMPTIAMPPGKAPAVPLSVAPLTPSAPAVAPVSPIAAPVAPPPPITPVKAVAPPPPVSSGSRAPMISGAPMKKSQLVERVIAAQTSRLIKEVGLDPNGPEILAIARISAEVIERVVWEVVPDLAEAIIRENLDRLAAARR